MTVFKNILVTLFIFLYKMLYRIYLTIRKIVFSITGPIHFTYIFDKKENNFKNITLNYYLNVFIKNNIDNEFYFKTHTLNTTAYYSCSGNIYEVPHIVTVNNEKIKRRDILLFDINKNTIDFDLNLLDNFYKNSKKINNHFDIDLLLALKFFNVESCRYVQFFQLIPFKKQDIDLKLVKISELFI